MSAKRRPKVPRELVGLFWRIRVIDWEQRGIATQFLFCTKREALASNTKRMCGNAAKLYRVTVWKNLKEK